MLLLNKCDLRKKYISIRQNITEREFKNQNIFDKTVCNEYYKNSECIFCYVSVESEVDTTELIKYSLFHGKKVAVPKCIDKNGEMKFYYINSFGDLHMGMYSIPEPNEYCIPAVNEYNTVCIVPCICCDEYGYRIGYGKGYYDRFLRDFKGKKIVLSYGECICDKVEFNTFDVKCDIVIHNDER